MFFCIAVCSGYSWSWSWSPECFSLLPAGCWPSLLFVWPNHYFWYEVDDGAGRLFGVMFGEEVALVVSVTLRLPGNKSKYPGGRGHEILKVFVWNPVMTLIPNHFSKYIIRIKMMGIKTRSFTQWIKYVSKCFICVSGMCESEAVFTGLIRCNQNVTAQVCATRT